MSYNGGFYVVLYLTSGTVFSLYMITGLFFFIYPVSKSWDLVDFCIC